jgi:hypothetical protein
MDKQSLKIYVKKAVREAMEGILKENQPQPSPSSPDTDKETIERPPGEKTIPTRRRTLRPGKDAPDETPAKALMKENEKEILKKIAQRFKNLK